MKQKKKKKTMRIDIKRKHEKKILQEKGDMIYKILKSIVMTV